MGTTPRTIAVAVRVRDRLNLVLQQHRRRSLSYPVTHTGYAENSDTRPMIFRYLHRPHRPRKVTPRTHPVPQPVKVVLLPAVELGDAHGIHARRPLIGPDLLPRPINQALVDLKRLHHRLRSTHRLLPTRVDHWAI